MIELYRGQLAREAGRGGKSAAGADQADISQNGKDLQTVMNRLRSLPDVRGDLVAGLKQQVSSGTYRVDSSRVVDGMLQERKLYQEAARAR